jgi:hypothetical protein
LSVWVVKGKNYSTKVLEETLIKLKKSFI